MLKNIFSSYIVKVINSDVSEKTERSEEPENTGASCINVKPSPEEIRKHRSGGA
jgi:hypothetical protein